MDSIREMMKSVSGTNPQTFETYVCTLKGTFPRHYLVLNCHNHRYGAYISTSPIPVIKPASQMSPEEAMTSALTSFATVTRSSVLSHIKEGKRLRKNAERVRLALEDVLNSLSKKSQDSV